MSTSFAVQASEPDNYYGYRRFRKGKFEFHRDEYFVHIRWPKGSHTMAADAFLRALQRDIAWNFFYGTVNFDGVFGTLNHYGTVDMFAGRFNDAYRKAGIDYNETYRSEDLMATFKAMLDDWTNRGYDPFAAPEETKQPYGRKDGDNKKAIERLRITAKRMVGLPSDTPVRSDANGYRVNRHFADVPQDQPVVHAQPGFENEVSAFNLFAYLSRSDVTWNPSVCSVVKESLYCPTSEEFILPVEHGNDRVEWFMQLSDEIIWEVKDKETGAPRARVIARAGDICAMPADIRHQGYSPKRSMLLVWENNSSSIPELIASGKAPVVPVKF
jgi:Hydroquinone 1,2-dioxygenase large subunit N-terminal